FIIENVIDVLKNKAPIATSAEEGKNVVDIIERIYALRPSYLSEKNI
ncbi:MAG: gfo/Idh/MocA family oxidoreductase, partial [Fimbriimonadaceae bacterium]|nr:gfo/Idh/MocA family oxidoreductase [Chitinophagales bacterium]